MYPPILLPPRVRRIDGDYHPLQEHSVSIEEDRMPVPDMLQRDGNGMQLYVSMDFNQIPSRNLVDQDLRVLMCISPHRMAKIWGGTDFGGSGGYFFGRTHFFGFPPHLGRGNAKPLGELILSPPPHRWGGGRT